MLLKLGLVLSVACAISAQILPPSGIRRVRPGPVVQTLFGPVQGQEETYDILRRIHTFKGIRYAQPPTGNMRFRQAWPPVPWREVYKAWDYGNSCPQLSILLNRVQGDEDCLFLNIAAPTNIISRLPVVVSIHGGGLQAGNGDMSVLGPELINQENVIFVSFNYRLNVLGFLNSGDINSPGNYGIKDMISALQWVRANIGYFGGNPDDVTIMGISGGAVGVHALVVSPAASGLFHRALSQSGSLFNTWGFTQNPTRSMRMLADNLGLEWENNSTLLVEQLRSVSVERLLKSAGLVNDANPRLFQEMNFAPSPDVPVPTEPRIFPAPISFLVRNGNINRVPYMIGFNSVESMYSLRDVYGNPTILERFNQNPNLLIPPEWNLRPNSTEAFEVINAFRSIYFGGSPVITQDMAWQWTQYVSDREFIFGISKQARLHETRQSVYYFRFSYSGALSFAQRAFGFSEVPGAMHGDDAFYLFRLNLGVTPVLPGDEAFTIQRRYVRMWTNFMKYSNPTPSERDRLINATWPQMTSNVEFMDIGTNLVRDVYPFRSRLEIWHLFDQRFNE
jgi:carboxylesterase type B